MATGMMIEKTIATLAGTRGFIRGMCRIIWRLLMKKSMYFIPPERNWLTKKLIMMNSFMESLVFSAPSEAPSVILF
jgi:hypothetical protein